MYAQISGMQQVWRGTLNQFGDLSVKFATFGPVYMLSRLYCSTIYNPRAGALIWPQLISGNSRIKFCRPEKTKKFSRKSRKRGENADHPNICGYCLIGDALRLPAFFCRLGSTGTAVRRTRSLHHQMATTDHTARRLTTFAVSM
jgi:hypothetical protein